jgi:lysine decarboxylase
MQIPGHKNRYTDLEIGQGPQPLGYDLLHDVIRDDLPLQGGADDNHFNNGYDEDAEALYAAAIGAAHTRFLVNGSSQGNIAALLAAASDGERIAVDRTSHRSALAGLQLSGGLPVWVFPDLHPEFGLPIGVPTSALAGLPTDITAISVTSPAYVGTMSQVRGLADAAHALNVPLVVDQAWGAHLDWMHETHAGAIAQGADLVVTSIHKALMGYSQTAIVSTSGHFIDPKRLDRAVDLTMTTSPSATLLASIDATRAIMEMHGAEAIARAIEATDAAKRLLRAVAGLVVIDDAEIGSLVDPLKITLWLPRTGVTGVVLGAAMWAEGHGVESADTDSLVMSVSIVDEAAFIMSMAQEVAGIIEKLRGPARDAMPTALWQIRPEVVVAPRQALFAKRRRVAMDDAIGHVSAEQFVPYPPGVPLLAPGERVTRELVDAIRLAGRIGRVSYCSDRTFQTIEIVDDLA